MDYQIIENKGKHFRTFESKESCRSVAFRNKINQGGPQAYTTKTSTMDFFKL